MCMKGRSLLFKSIIVVIVVIISALSIGVSSKVIYKKIQSQEEKSVLEAYKKSQEKIELLQTLPKKVIKNGTIHIKKIPKEIQYQIYNKEDKIIFYYCVGEYAENNNFSATITLSSKDGKILEEKYGTEEQPLKKQTLREYKEYHSMINKVLSILYSIIIVLLVWMVILIIIGIIKYFKKEHAQIE